MRPFRALSVMGVLSALVAFAPLAAHAWQGGASGEIVWASSEARGALVSAVFVGQVDATRLRLVVTLDLPTGSGDGVLTLDLPEGFARGRTVALPAPGARLRYAEYAADGRVVFESTRAAGTARALVDAAGMSLSLDLAVSDAGGQWRRVRGGDVGLPTDPDDPDAIAAARARAPYVLAAQDEPSGDSGCGGDDDELWRDDARSDASGYAPDQTTGSGCGPSEPSTASSSETDTLGDGADTASGCEGDDVSADETGDDGCGDSCEGDGLAEASSSARVRAHHAWVGRCVAWLPWALAFTAVRLMRRAARRGAR